jgi:hypothetical protein
MRQLRQHGGQAKQDRRLNAGAAENSDELEKQPDRESRQRTAQEDVSS